VGLAHDAPDMDRAVVEQHVVVGDRHDALRIRGDPGQEAERPGTARLLGLDLPATPEGPVPRQIAQLVGLGVVREGRLARLGVGLVLEGRALYDVGLHPLDLARDDRRRRQLVERPLARDEHLDDHLAGGAPTLLPPADADGVDAGELHEPLGGPLREILVFLVGGGHR
jgi:hypothetical protein